MKKLAAILILVGTFTQSLVMVKSGLNYSFGLGFWGPNAHDGLWHVSLINQLSKLDFTHPSFAGSPLVNYHYGFDLIAAFISRLTQIPPLTLYFQVLPVATSLSIGILIYLLTFKIWKSNTVTLWALFFTYFGGSFGYLVNLLKGQGLGGESAFWSIQSISYPLNPPFTLSLVFFFSALLLFGKYLSKPKTAYLVATSLLFGSLIMVKVYAGLVALSVLLLVSLWSFVKTRDLKTAKVFLLSFVVSCIIFFPSNRNSPSLVKLEPLWFPRTMMQFADRVGWIRFANARLAYEQLPNYPKWVTAEIVAIILFLLGNLGMRIIGAYSLYKSRVILRHPGPENTLVVFLGLAGIISIVPTLLFVQKGNPWNIIQFFYYTQIFLGLFAAVTLKDIFKLKKPLLTFSFLFLTLILTLPSTIGTLPNFLPVRPPAAILPHEVSALSFLASQPEGTVLTYPFDRALFGRYTEPRPVMAYESTAYVSALSGKTTFLEDEMNLEISLYPWQERKAQITEFFTNPDSALAREFLAKNNIRYLYLLKDQNYAFNSSQVGLMQIYDDPRGVRIYLVSDKI